MSDPPRPPPVVRLRCRRCGWLSGAAPDAELQAHQAQEHPGEGVAVELVVVCPGCGDQHPVAAGQIAPTLTAFAKLLFPTARTKLRPGRR
jgi:hypothetical protein